jgi:hypothetical protein
MTSYAELPHGITAFDRIDGPLRLFNHDDEWFEGLVPRPDNLAGHLESMSKDNEKVLVSPFFESYEQCYQLVFELSKIMTTGRLDSKRLALEHEAAIKFGAKSTVKSWGDNRVGPAFFGEISKIPKTIPSGTIRQAFEEIGLLLRRAGGQFKSLTYEESYELMVKSTNSGYPWGTRKSNVTDQLGYLAKKFYDYVVAGKGGTIPILPAVMSRRSRRYSAESGFSLQSISDTDLVGSRPVFMGAAIQQPAHIAIQRPIADALLKSGVHLSLAGQDVYASVFREIPYEAVSRGREILSLDITAFDQHVHQKWFIEMARMLVGLFPAQADKYLVENAIWTMMYTPLIAPGTLWRKDGRAVVSGHTMTNTADSLITLCMLWIVAKRLLNENLFLGNSGGVPLFNVNGDDHFMTAPEGVVSESDIVNLYHVFGFPTSEGKSGIGPFLTMNSRYWDTSYNNELDGPFKAATGTLSSVMFRERVPKIEKGEKGLGPEGWSALLFAQLSELIYHPLRYEVFKILVPLDKKLLLGGSAEGLHSIVDNHLERALKATQSPSKPGEQRLSPHRIEETSRLINSVRD